MGHPGAEDKEGDQTSVHHCREDHIAGTRACSSTCRFSAEMVEAIECMEKGDRRRYANDPAHGRRGLVDRDDAEEHAT